MRERILFVTGKLAENSLRRTLSALPDRTFTYEVRVLGVSVAALMTTALIGRRLGAIADIDRVIIPGRCRGDLEPLNARFSVPFERGPDELKDLPRFFGMAGQQPDLSRTDIRIFAEIVDAPNQTIEAILERANQYRSAGADVIDLGCLPSTPFPHLEETIEALHAERFAVSVDSLVDDELLRGGRAGADYLFSLSERTLWIADELSATPILIGDDPNDLASLSRTVDAFAARGRPFYADAILDPIHYGLTQSIMRYAQLRERYPDIEIMMGIGNLSELTHADTLGINTTLLGIASELRVSGLLTTEVSGHCISTVREIDLGRRIMFAARADGSPPRHVDEGLLALHDRHPFPYDADEIRELAKQIRDANFRIYTSPEGISIFNRDGLYTADDPYELFPNLDVGGDGAHAFYLGLELARAQIAYQLGKRYEQDEELRWGVIVPSKSDDKIHFGAPKSTLKKRRDKDRSK